MTKQEMVAYLLNYLIKENHQFKNIRVPQELSDQENLLRALLNVRPPMAVSNRFLSVQNDYLQLKKAEKVVVFIDHLKPLPIDDRLYLWQGDITRLKVDAIVNAANKELQGCFQPLHDCIDNAIHTYAGVQLRRDCYRLIQNQGHEEYTGYAKITPAYNLPAKYVLHTVGPIIRGKVTPRDEELLAQCYLSCLSLAEKNDLESIAFCCISTGVFNFPRERAAQIATQTVRDFIKNNKSLKKIIFDVFTDEDLTIYQRLLSK